MQKKLIPAFFLTFVNILGFSILMPVLPFVVKDFGAPEWAYGLLLTLYSAFQFVGAPYLGSMSDRVGRKPVLLISQAGTLLSWFIFLGALYIPREYSFYGYSLALLVIALSRALDGITGGNMSVTNAYVSDVTTKEEKSYVFGYLGGIVGIGMIVGPGLGGLTASSSYGYIGTLLTAIFISSVTLITIWFYLKESFIPDEKNPVKSTSIIDSLAIRRKIKKLNPSPIIKQLFAMKFFFMTLMAFYISTIALYLIDLFHFDKLELGYFMFVVGVFLAFNQAVLAKIIVKRIGEMKTLFLGIVLSIVGVLSITATENLFVFVPLYYVMNLGISLSMPMFSSLISINADPKKQGEVMGISDSISSFCMALFPVISASIYGAIGKNIYYLMTLFPLAALVIAFYCFKQKKVKTQTVS